MKELIIIGASGFGREVAWLVERINTVEPTWSLLGFLDDNPEMTGKIVDDYPVLGGCDKAKDYPDAYYVCAIASSGIRKNVIEKLGVVNYATIVDPNILISDKVTIGEGTIICAGTIITVNVSIGSHVIINLNSTIGHDSVIHNFVTLYPSVNVSGITNIGECSEVGTGAQIIQRKKIGSNSIVGSGAVVVRDIPDDCTAAGCPAKVIRKKGVQKVPF